MPSKLYQGAVESLSEPERSALSGFEGWLEPYIADLFQGSSVGGGILKNIRNESHLVGDDEYGDTKSMAAATFEHDGGAPRQDATAMSKALALPIWQGVRTGKEFLVELAYSSHEVEDPRFPTVADACWIHLFRPAVECEPSGDDLKTCCGWTDPLDGQPAQPELVHENRPLRLLDRPPRFVGRVPL